MAWGLQPKPGVTDTQCCTDMGRHKASLGVGQCHVELMLQGSPLDQAETRIRYLAFRSFFVGLILLLPPPYQLLQGHSLSKSFAQAACLRLCF